MPKPFDPIVNDGRSDGPRSPLERLGWKYARDEITLEQFEQSCAIWVRWLDEHPEDAHPSPQTPSLATVDALLKSLYPGPICRP